MCIIKAAMTESTFINHILEVSAGPVFLTIPLLDYVVLGPSYLGT